MKIRKTRQKVENTLIYAFLSFMSLLSLLPLSWILSTAIKTKAEVYSNPPVWIPDNPTLENFISVLTESSIPSAFVNSFVIGVMTAAIALIVGGMSGYALARFDFKGSKFYSLFMLSSQMLPLTVLMIPIFYLFHSMDLIDTKLGVSMAHLIIALPMVTWMTKGYFKGIPKEIEEAAMVDGCTRIKSLYYVVLPLVKPALISTGVYAFICSWNELLLVSVLTRTDATRTLPIALLEFSTYFMVDWGDTMAAAFLITMPVVIAFLLVQKHFIEGLVSGAVKD